MIFLPLNVLHYLNLEKWCKQRIVQRSSVKFHIEVQRHFGPFGERGGQDNPEADVLRICSELLSN